MADMDQVRRDFAAFADDDADVDIDVDGTVVFVREGVEQSVQLRSDHASGLVVAAGDGPTVPYKEYLARSLGRLETLAERLLHRRSAVPGGYIDTKARLDRAGQGRQEGQSSALLHDECQTAPPFAVRLTFLTADAGHGKSALFRHYQQQVAEAFLHKECPFLFWHVDLQGRQLLRLSEALMGDLGDLRVSGIWVAAVHRLVRAGALVLAIDGFDELAAEQGNTDALGALATLIRELGDHGTVMAASRRAFFDSQDYLQRAGAFRKVMPQSSQFDQIELMPWGEEEGRKYFRCVELNGETFKNPDASYEALKSGLGGDQEHPILSRPFLLYQAARALLEYKLEPMEFIRSMEDPHKGVAAVVQAFVDREVMEKWKSRETGRPYLDSEQHMVILGDVAEEMYRAGRDRLPLDIIETLVSMRLEEWAIDQSRRRQIMDMVRVHVLLRPPADSHFAQRAFDHPEFRDYFIAHALQFRLREAASGAASRRLIEFLSAAQLPDATARYVASIIQLSDAEAAYVLNVITAECQKERKTTHLNVNAGTLIPPILSGRSFESELIVDAKGVVFASLVFRGGNLQDIRIVGGQFVSVWLQDVTWRNVTLDQVDVGELTIDRDSSSFNGVTIVGLQPQGVRVREEGEEIDRVYAPHQIQKTLRDLGIDVTEASEFEHLAIEVEDSEFAKQVRRLLRHFYRSTVITSRDLENRFRKVDIDPQEIIDLMVDRDLLVPETWKGAGQHAIWRLNCGLDELLRSEGGEGAENLVGFWQAVHGRREGHT